MASLPCLSFTSSFASPNFTIEVNDGISSEIHVGLGYGVKVATKFQFYSPPMGAKSFEQILSTPSSIFPSQPTGHFIIEKVDVSLKISPN